MRRRRYWQLLLGVFFLGWIFMYADRTVLSPALPAIGAEWRLNTAQLGLISSLFFLLYAAMQIPTGFLADRFGRKLLLVPGYLLFGVTTVFSAFAPSYGVFLLLGALSGAGQGTYYPTQFSLSSEAIPQRVRGLGSAIINSGQAFGISLGFVVASVVAFDLRAGWRAPFAILGCATVVAGLVLWLCVREHPPAADADATDASGVGNVPAESPLAAPSGAGTRVLFSRDMVLAYAVMFCSLYGFFVVLTWLPAYLQTARHTPASQTGIVSSLVPWASIPGALAISLLSDRLRQRRIFAMLLLPLAALALLAIPLTQTRAELYAVLVLYGLVGKLALDPLMVAFVADRVPRAAYSRAYAFFNFAGMSSSILAPYLTGLLASHTGTLVTGFYLAAALLVAGTVCMAFTTPDNRRAQRDPGAESGSLAAAPGAAR